MYGWQTWNGRQIGIKVCLYSIMVLIMPILFFGGFEEFVRKTLVVPDNANVGENPPFYFIRRDFVHGISAGVAVFVMLVLAASTWRVNRQDSVIVVFMAWIWCAPSIVEACIICFRCKNLLDAQRATSGWATLDEYLNDPYRRLAFWATLLSGMAWMRFVNRKVRSGERLSCAVSSPVTVA